MMRGVVPPWSTTGLVKAEFGTVIMGRLSSTGGRLRHGDRR